MHPGTAFLKPGGYSHTPLLQPSPLSLPLTKVPSTATTTNCCHWQQQGIWQQKKQQLQWWIQKGPYTWLLLLPSLHRLPWGPPFWCPLWVSAWDSCLACPPHAVLSSLEGQIQRALLSEAIASLYLLVIRSTILHPGIIAGTIVLN